MYKPKESNSSTYNAYMNLNFEGNTFIALSDSLLLTHFIVTDYFDCVSWLVTVSNFATKLDFFFHLWNLDLQPDGDSNFETASDIVCQSYPRLL